MMLTKTGKPYPTLRDFVATAIAGDYTADEVIEILDNIEQGVGLQEHEKQYAQALEDAPANDDADPVYQRGLVAGGQRAIAAIVPWLELTEFGAPDRKCPCCGYTQVHRGTCNLDAMLRSLRAARQRVAEGVAAEQRDAPMCHDPKCATAIEHEVGLLCDRRLDC
jgi:hypothetical protein